MSDVKNYIIGTILTLGSAVLYEKYIRHDKQLQLVDHQNLIQQFLLNSDSLEDTKKPILWIHVAHEKNARWWQSFYSRNTDYLNQPYIFLTIRSIIQHCAKSFQICLIDDESFATLLPNWSHDISNMPEPSKGHVRSLALAKMLHKFGGLLVPNSFICMKDLLPLYNSGIASTDTFICELQPKGNVSDNTYYFPSTRFMGCIPDAINMKDLSHYISIIISNDSTNQLDFTDELNRVCYEMILNRKISVVCGSKIGIKMQNGKPLAIEDIMNDSYINMPNDMYGLYIPADKILKRSKYQWFARLSTAQALSSNTMIGKYLLICHGGI
jgi:hypothetical protein